MQSTIQPPAIESSVRYLSSSASWLIGFLTTVCLLIFFVMMRVLLPVEFQLFEAGAILLRLLIPLFFGKCIALFLLQDLGTHGERVIVRPDCFPVIYPFTNIKIMQFPFPFCGLELCLDSPAIGFRPTLVLDTNVCVVRKVFFQSFFCAATWPSGC